MDTDDAPFSLDSVLKGFSGIMFLQRELQMLPAKVIKNLKKMMLKNRPYLKGASIDTDLFIGEDQSQYVKRSLNLNLSLSAKSLHYYNLLLRMLFLLFKVEETTLAGL